MPHTPPTTPTWPDSALADPHARASSMLIPGMLVGALLLGIGCASGIVVGYLGATSYYGLNALAGGFDATPVLADVEVAHPETVPAGEPFDLVVTITDNGGQGQTLETLDLNGSVCDNFDVIRITPEPADSFSEYGWREYTYAAPIAPNGSAVYTLTLRPKHDGVYEGTLDAYFEDWNSITIDLSIVVVSGE